MPSLADFSWNSIASEDETKTERAQILLKKTKDPDPEISAGAWTILRVINRRSFTSMLTF